MSSQQCTDWTDGRFLSQVGCLIGSIFGMRELGPGRGRLIGCLSNLNVGVRIGPGELDL